MPRLPDFLVVGAMKCATTTLHRWLGQQPDSWTPEWKEVNFFSGRTWDRGVEWYSELFAPAPPEALVGESSPQYSDPSFAALAAGRIRAVVPEVRLVYLVRHPIERLRSHYAHEVRQGREKRRLGDAIAHTDSLYVRRSVYLRGIEPYLELFDRGQIAIVRTEDLVADHERGWDAIMSHLGLTFRPSPGTAYNVSAEKPTETKAFRMLADSRLYGLRNRLPGPLRAGLRRAIAPPHRRATRRRADPIPGRIADFIWEQTMEFEEAIGAPVPLWDREGGDDS